MILFDPRSANDPAVGTAKGAHEELRMARISFKAEGVIMEPENTIEESELTNVTARSAQSLRLADLLKSTLACLERDVI